MLHFPRNHYDVPVYSYWSDSFIYYQYPGSFILDDYGNAVQIAQGDFQYDYYAVGELH